MEVIGNKFIKSDNMALIGNVKIKRDSLKMYVEQTLIPELNKQFNNSEKNNESLKIEYIIRDIKILSGIEDSTDNSVYVSLKQFLLDTEFGVSIKRIPKNSKFIFFKKSGNINRETDIFKDLFDKKFKKILEEYLSRESVLRISANVFKEYVGYNEYENTNLYNRLKNLLRYSEKFDISIGKNVIVDGISTTIFEFYKQKDYAKTREFLSKYIIPSEPIDEDKEDFNEYLKESEKKEKEKKAKMDKLLIENGAKFMKEFIIPDVETYKCPNCEKGILKCPEIICPICKLKVLEKWD